MIKLNKLDAVANVQPATAESLKALELQTNDNAMTMHNATPMLPVLANQSKLTAQELSQIQLDGNKLFASGKCIHDRNGNLVDFIPDVTIENTRRLMKDCGFFVRYNLISRAVELLGTPDEWGNTHYDLGPALTHILDIANRNRLKLKKDQLYDFIWAIAHENQYNPVYAVLSSLEWDGIDRLDMLVKSIESESTAPALIKLLLTKWLISAVALGCADESSQLLSAGGMLVLVGPQGIGKGQFLKWLTAPLQKYFLEGAILNPSEKDSISRMVRYWVVELGELDGTLSKSNIAPLKAMLTSEKDVFRPAYGRTDVVYRRRTVFAATINHDNFLEDKTGSRRFWTIDVNGFNAYKKLDVLQVWAQVYQLYLEGVSWHLNSQEQQLLERSNSQHKVIDTIDDSLSSTFMFDADPFEWLDKMTSVEILKRIGFEKPTPSETRRLTESLKAKGVKLSDSTRDGIRARYWLMPPKFRHKTFIDMNEHVAIPTYH